MRLDVRSGFLFFAGLVAAQGQPSPEIVQKIVDVEKRLPWFWTPYPEGIRDVPYAYEYTVENHTLNSKGEEVLPPKLKSGHYKHLRSIHLEHIPLKTGWGWTTRCIQQDGIACMATEFDVPPTKDPDKFRAAREKRRLQRVALWDEFLRAFHFDLTNQNHLHFTPTGTYKNRGVANADLFEKVAGELWFDPATYEIYHMEFELTADVGNFVTKLYKGTRFSIDLTKAIDDHYLPSMWSLKMNRRLLTSKGAAEGEVRYFNYRKFETSSTITFADKE